MGNNNNCEKHKKVEKNRFCWLIPVAESWFRIFYLYCTYDTNAAWIVFFENLNLITTILVSWMVVHAVCLYACLFANSFFLSRLRILASTKLRLHERETQTQSVARKKTQCQRKFIWFEWWIWPPNDHVRHTSTTIAAVTTIRCSTFGCLIGWYSKIGPFILLCMRK